MIRKYSLLIVAIVMLSTTLTQAVTLKGNITIAGGAEFGNDDGTSQGDDIAAATRVVSWYNTRVVTGDGDFATFAPPNKDVAFNPFQFKPTLAQPELFTIDDMSASLISGGVVFQNETFFAYKADIMFTKPGFESTMGTLTLTSQAPGATSDDGRRIVSISMAGKAAMPPMGDRVPDKGGTAGLLAAGIGVMIFVRRKIN